MTRMLDPQDAMFANPYWHALRTMQSAIALDGTRNPSGPDALALRFPPDVIPFAGMAQANAESLAAVRDLLAPGEALYVTAGELPPCDGLAPEGQLPGWQMLFAGPAPHHDSAADPHIVELVAANAHEMVCLTDVAFPGFFRLRTYTLGRYFGVRVRGELVAMAGERLALPGWREISAVCTHPEHRGHGYAAALIRHLLRTHAVSGLGSFLHVGQANAVARRLYEGLGFTTTREVLFHHIRRSSSGTDPNAQAW